MREELLSLVKSSGNWLTKIYMYLQYKKLYKFEKKFVAKYDLCIAVSEEDRMTLSAMCPAGKYIIIANGVDIEYFKPGDEKPRPNSMIWVGGMSDMYNRQAINYFCDKIFPIIRDEIEDVKLTVIGKSPTKKLIELARKNGNVEYVGYVDDIRQHVHKSLLFIAPIVSGGGTKFKILNALSMGKAVITTTIGAEGIEATNERNIIIADSYKEFARKAVGLLNDYDRVLEIGANARKLIVEKYNWEEIGKKYNRAYLEVVKAKRER